MIDSKPKQLEVSLQLTRPQGWDFPDKFRLVIEDRSSNLRILEAEFDIEAFANLLSTRLAYGKCELFTDQRIGKTHENKTVQLKNIEFANFATVQKQAQDWEKKNLGWEIDKYNIKTWNSHNYKNNLYKVVARRWV